MLRFADSGLNISTARLSCFSSNKRFSYDPVQIDEIHLTLIPMSRINTYPATGPTPTWVKVATRLAGQCGRCEKSGQIDALLVADP